MSILVNCIIVLLPLIIVMVITKALKRDDEPRVMSSCQGEAAKLIHLNRMRIEMALVEQARELAVLIVGKYMQAIGESQSLSVLISLEQEVSPELFNRTAELLITKGWEISSTSNAANAQVTVTPVEPRKTLRKHRRGQVIGGARYWG